MPKRIAYGLKPDLPTFAGLTPAAVGERLVEAGCDGVFLSSLDQGWVTALQQAGLAVYCSLGVFAGDGVWEQFPGARPVMADGEPAPRQGWYEPAIPTLPDLRIARLERLSELAESLPLDGVWLDFIRWPARWEGAQPRLYDSSFDPVTLAQFQAESGIILPPAARTAAQAASWILTEAPETWLAWRCQQVTDFVVEARTVLKKHRPAALLGLFTVPWAADDFEGANIRIVGQNLSQLGRHADVISPMVYHRMCGQSSDWVARVSGWAGRQSDAAVWPIIEAVDPGDRYPVAEFIAAGRAALSVSQTLMVFTLAGLFEDQARISAWQAL